MHLCKCANVQAGTLKKKTPPTHWGANWNASMKDAEKAAIPLTRARTSQIGFIDSDSELQNNVGATTENSAVKVEI